MKKIMKIAIIWFIIFIISGIISETYFRNMEAHLSNYEIKILGDATIKTSFVYNMSNRNTLPQIFGSNWCIKINNVKNISYSIRKPNDYTYEKQTVSTKNLTITGGSFIIWSIISMQGFIKIKKIETSYDSFKIFVESGIISINNSSSEIYPQGSTLLLSDGTKIYTDDLEQSLNPFYLTYTSKPLINISLGNNDHLRDDSIIIGHLANIKIDGTISISKFEGMIGNNGNLYFNGPITIESRDMRIITKQLPESGVRHGFGWAHEPKYWTIQIQSESGVNVKGFGLPYWFIGLVFNLIGTTIIFILIIIKIFYVKKRKKKMEKIRNYNKYYQNYYNNYWNRNKL